MRFKLQLILILNIFHFCADTEEEDDEKSKRGK